MHRLVAYCLWTYERPQQELLMTLGVLPVIEAPDLYTQFWQVQNHVAIHQGAAIRPHR